MGALRQLPKPRPGMSKDRPTAAGMSPDELQAHQEAVEDALHQADYVRRFIEYVSLYATSETRIESLFWPAGMTRN
jgi:hypothetical protein